MLPLCSHLLPMSPRLASRRMFFSLFHTEPHLLSLHFLSQDTALPRTNPSGRAVSFRGNSNYIHKGVIGPVPCPPKKRLNLWSCTHFPSPQPTSLSTSCQNAGDFEVCMSSGSSLLSTTAPNTFYKKTHKTPEKTEDTEKSQATFIAGDISFYKDCHYFSYDSFYSLQSMGHPGDPKLSLNVGELT